MNRFLSRNLDDIIAGLTVSVVVMAAIVVVLAVTGAGTDQVYIAALAVSPSAWLLSVGLWLRYG